MNGVTNKLLAATLPQFSPKISDSDLSMSLIYRPRDLDWGWSIFIKIKRRFSSSVSTPWALVFDT
jgi:hypothetical protein